MRTKVDPPATWRRVQVDRREREIALALAGWAAASVAGGAALLARGDAAAGRQHLVWGAVDGAIAARGLLGAPDRTTAPAARVRRLRRLLLVNAAIDVGYVAAGLALRSGRLRPGLEADGTAVVVQGGFLLVFDLLQAGRLHRP
ncbi:MAG TPA: hypothetical protein VF661_05320 [Actinomycetales bacterium]|jgi:hypothetical protein